MLTQRLFMAGMLLATGLATSACDLFPLTILSINLENPSPRVGEATTLRLEVSAPIFSNPQYYYRAKRGRIVGLNGETGAQGGFVRATNQVRYYAPYTSSYQAPDGIRQDDNIEILIQNGTSITRGNRNVQIVGSTVVFSTQATTAVTGTCTTGTNGTIMIATDTGGQQQTQPTALKDLSGRNIMGTSPVISPNGERIAYVYFPGDGTSKIMMRDSAGQVLALTNNAKGLNLDPAWSPDGNYLLFAGNHETSDGTYEIYMENVDQVEGGRAVTRLTNNNWDERHPAWNPVAIGNLTTGTTATTSTTGTIAVSARKNTLQSPGGRQQNWNIFLLDARGNYVREISGLQGDGDNWAIEPSWRPDGNAIAYTRYGPVNNFQSNAAKFQRIFVQELNQSTQYQPLNLSNTDPNAKESSPIWSIAQQNLMYFLRTEGSFQQGARVYQTQYVPGGGSNTFPPALIGPFQAQTLQLTEVGCTNRDISGYHPLDWR